MDAIDQAEATREEHNAQALKIHIMRKNSGMSQFPTNYCVDCWELIPAERKAAYPDAIRCVGCQSKFEKRNNRA